MTRHTLGISSFYHDSAAAIVTDSTVVAAAQEERFTLKHDPSFPQNAINYCLGEAFWKLKSSKQWPFTITLH